MAKQGEEPIIDVQEVYSKTEHYVEKHKNNIIYAVIGVIAIVGIYLAYDQFVVKPQQATASSMMWKAEQYFEKDSFNLALDGDGNYYGFLQIADDYSACKAGNLANYYIGISYLKLGKYQDAIDYLEKFNSDDDMLEPVATGAIGDAYMELGDTDKALQHYLDAAEQNVNKFTSPIYLMKAGMVYETLNDYSNAKVVYKKIKTDFPETNEGRNIDKYLAKVELLGEK